MNKPKWNWPEIEPDILAGMSDREVSDKYHVPYVTVQHHRLRELGILSSKGKKVLENREIRQTEPVPKTPNLHISMTKEQIANRNMDIMRHHLTKQHFEIWQQNQKPTSDWRRFVGGVR